MNKKLCIFIFILLETILLCSCQNSAKKNTAYCFSAIFDTSTTGVNITLYCRAPVVSPNENQGDAETVLTLSGKNFSEAFNSDIYSEYEIYYNSMKSLYFTQEISDSQLIEIVSELFNKTKYQTSVMVYSPDNKIPQDIPSIAMSVCTAKGIYNEKLKDYLSLTKYSRRLLNERSGK